MSAITKDEIDFLLSGEFLQKLLVDNKKEKEKGCFDKDWTDVNCEDKGFENVKFFQS